MKRKASDLLKEKGNAVYTIDGDSMLKDVIKIFNEKHIGALIVVNDAKEIQGIITERDILRKVARIEGEIKDISVKSVMTPRDQLKVGTPDDSLEYLMKVMTVNRFRHIPIVESEAKPSLNGIISIGDIVKSFLNDFDHENKFLRDFPFA